jgi:HEAT repeat protein
MAHLRHEKPKVRTSAAKILGQRQCRQAVMPLCRALRKEKKLYSKLAICEALGALGKPSIPPLIELLGRIGNNHENTLPKKGFYKGGYPLPRDMAARTLIRIGEPALTSLLPVLDGGEPFQMEQALDAIGHISFYSDNSIALPHLIGVLKTYREHEVICWKTIRAFEAFNDEQVIRILTEYLLRHPIPAYRWESARSLGIIGLPSISTVLIQAQNDPHPEVQKMVQLAMGRISLSCCP